MMEELQNAISENCRATRKWFKEMLHLNMTKAKVKLKRCLIVENVHHVAQIPKLSMA